MAVVLESAVGVGLGCAPNLTDTVATERVRSQQCNGQGKWLINVIAPIAALRFRPLVAGVNIQS
jgi:hypothetical protein